MFISPIGLMADYRIRAAKWGLQDLSLNMLCFMDYKNSGNSRNTYPVKPIGVKPTG
jgi:hypothetical protein